MTGTTSIQRSGAPFQQISHEIPPEQNKIAKSAEVIGISASNQTEFPKSANVEPTDMPSHIA